MKARSVRFRRLGAWLNPPHRWLCVERRLLPQTPTDGGCRGENGSGVFERRAFYSLPVSVLEMSHVRDSRRPVLFHLSSASHVLSLYSGARMLCFCFHLLPSQHSPVFYSCERGHWKREQREGWRRTKRKSLT